MAMAAESALMLYAWPDPSEPIATALRRSGRLLWLGAVEPATKRR